MKKLFTQPGKGSTSIGTNKQAIARHFGVKQSEVVYFSDGEPISGFKVIYDKTTQRAYSLPTGIPAGTTATSLSNKGVLVHSAGSVDLGKLAVSREEYVKLTDTFTSGFTINVSNELVSDGTYFYRWDGDLPKQVNAGSTPQNSGGMGLGTWMLIGEAALHQLLREPGGANIIGTLNGETVEARLEAFGNPEGAKRVVTSTGMTVQELLDEMPVFQNRAAVRQANIPERVAKIRVLADETGNNWHGVYTTDDPGNSTNIVSANGRIWQLEVPNYGSQLGTIVVFGSSTAGGYGTADFTEYPSLNTNWQSSPSSWVSVLARKLGSRAKVINRSIGGYNTDTNISRFMRDVAPHKPDFVILCTGWFNEPGGDEWGKGANYILGTRRLIALCRLIGAQPIVAPLQALSSGNSTTYVQYDIARALASENVPVIDLASAVMLPGSAAVIQPKFDFGDGVHTNSAAHALYAEAFDLGYLDLRQRAPVSTGVQKGYLIGAHNATSPKARAPVRMWVNRDLSFGPLDWTVQVTLRSPGSGDKGGVALQLLLDDGSFLKVRAFSPDAPTVRLTKSDNTVIVDSGVAWNGTTGLSIAVSYQSSTDTLMLLVGSATSPATTGGLSGKRLSAAHFGGMDSADTNSRMTGWIILEANLWRTASGHTINAGDRFARNDFQPAGLVMSLNTESTNAIVGDNTAFGYGTITLYNTSSVIV